ncbi:MAG TPA: hypothetical protein VFO41_00025 [Alphaproteobacteria bacterium]|nr:hypothetical protein [Alphaproteobacteria bacterium]
MTRRLLAQLGRAATPVLAFGIFAGLFMPPVASALQPLLLPSIVLLLALALLRLDWDRMGRYARRPGIVGLVVVWQLLLSPLVAFAIGSAFGLPAGLLAALTLNAASSPIMSSAAFAQLLDLDAPLSVVVVVAGTLLLPLTVTPIAFWLVDVALPIDAAGFLARIGVFIVLPFGVAFLVRRLAGEATLDRHDDAIAGATVVTLLVFAIAVMDGVAVRLLEEPGEVLLFLAVALAANIGFQILSTALFWLAGRRTAASIGLMSGNRNMGLILALTGGIAGEDFLLYLAVAQVPIYVLPLVAKPVYRRLMRGGRIEIRP